MKGLRRDFPKQICINGNMWRLYFRKMIEGKANVLGLCCPEDKVILIKVGQKPQARLQTFFHELLHAIEFEYGVKISHKLIYKLEGPLADIVAQNCWMTWADWKQALVENNTDMDE